MIKAGILLILVYHCRLMMSTARLLGSTLGIRRMFFLVLNRVRQKHRNGGEWCACILVLNIYTVVTTLLLLNFCVLNVALVIDVFSISYLNFWFLDSCLIGGLLVRALTLWTVLSSSFLV